VKEAEAVQEPFLGESEYPQHGQRVVDFALAYAAQNRNDYATVSAAARKGELAVAS
jgi:hypothetical protein